VPVHAALADAMFGCADAGELIADQALRAKRKLESGR